MNPKIEDTGKYTIEIMGIQSTAFLNVDGKFKLKIIIIKKLTGLN